MKTIRLTQQDLLNAISRRNHLWRLNDLRARNNPGFRQQLDYLRNYDGLADRARELEKHVFAGDGLGGVQALPYIAVAGGIVAVPLSLALLVYVWRQSAREEQAYATTNPLTYAARQLSTGVWAILGLGVVALGGLIYMDQRGKFRGEADELMQIRPMGRWR